MKLSLPHKSGECLYSALVRQWQMLGSPSPYKYRELIGLPKRHRIHPFLSTHINIFSSTFNIPSKYILNNLTLFPVFNALCHDSYRLKKSMLNDGTPSPLILSRIAQAETRLGYSIKYCPKCAIEERTKFGFASWQLLHQFPGIQACWIHGTKLVCQPMGEGGADRSFCRIPIELKSKFHDASKEEVLLARLTCDFYKACTTIFLGRGQVITWLSKQLKQKDLITSNGYIRQLELAKHIEGALEIDTIKVGSAEKVNVGNLGCILRTKTGFVSHPVKYAILFSCLSSVPNKKSIVVTLNSKASFKPKESDLADLLKDARSGTSINSLCIKYSKSKCFVTRQLELNNIDHRTNAMATDKLTQKMVLISAIMGVHRKEIASEFGVGLGFVEKVICNTPMLSQWRKQLRHQQKIKNSIESIKKLCCENPQLNRTQIRKLNEAEYALLYNENKELLFSILPKKIQPVPPGQKKK